MKKQIRYFIQYIMPAIISIIMVVIAAVQAKVSIRQLNLAENETLKAKEAKDIAIKASSKADLSLERAEDLEIKNRILLKKVGSTYQDLLVLQNENAAYKKYRHKLMGLTVSRKSYILLGANGTLDRTLDRYIKYNNSYSERFWSIFSFNEAVALNSKFKPSRGAYFDIFEISFLEWYGLTHFGSWYLERETDSGGSMPNVDKIMLTDVDLSSIFSHNSQFDTLKDKFQATKIYLPPDTNVKLKAVRRNPDKLRTEIQFTNKHVTVNVSFYCDAEFKLNQPLDIVNLGLSGKVKPEDNMKAIRIFVDADVSLSDNFVFDGDSAMTYSWATQLVKHIDQAFDGNFTLVRLY